MIPMRIAMISSLEVIELMSFAARTELFATFSKCTSPNFSLPSQSFKQGYARQSRRPQPRHNQIIYAAAVL
jgi:hypothetical protein